MRPPKATDRNQAEEHESHPDHIYRRSAEMGEQEPTDNASYDVASGQRNVDVEGLKFRETRLLEEFHGVAEDGIATQNLSGPDNAILRLKINLNGQM